MKYISREKCKFIKKKYVVPNVNWVKPLNDLDIFIKKKHDIHKLIANEKILIKITSGRNHDLRRFAKEFYQFPNFVKTYNVHFCYDNSSNVKNNQNFNCPMNDDYVKDCYHVTFELMHYYKKGSLTKYIHKYDKLKIHNILQQLLYCQLNMFAKYMYTHNDIKLSNILVDKHKKIVTLDYEFINKKIDVVHEYIISDYDKIVSFEQICLFTLSEIYTFTLFNNICQTIEMFDIGINNKPVLYEKSKNNVDEYYCQKINKREFQIKELSLNCQFVDEFLFNYIEK